jgi:hypothetical protein
VARWGVLLVIVAIGPSGEAKGPGEPTTAARRAEGLSTNRAV